MLLLFYFLLLLILTTVTRKQSQNIRMALRLGYNYLFVLAVQTMICILPTEEVGFFDAIKVLGKSLFMTVQYITFNGEIDWADQMSSNLQAQLWVIIFIASILTVQFVLVSFFGKIFNQLKLRFKGSLKKKHYIIMGKSEDAELLVSDIQSKVKNPYIIYIPTEQLDDHDSLYNICRIEKKHFLNHLSKKVQYYIVLLPDSQYGNLDIIYQLDNKTKDTQNIHVTAFLDNDIIRFQDIHTNNIDSCLVSKEQLLVQKCFNECSPIDILKDTNSFSERSELPYLEEPFDICIIGFSSIGQEFLLSSFEYSTFVTRDNKENFKALIIDEELSVRKEEFLTEVPYFESNNQLEFLGTKIHTLDYFNAIKSRISSLKQILISTEDTQLNIKTAFKLCRYFDRIGYYNNRPEIVIIFNDSCSGVEHLLEQYPNIRIIDINDQIINYETLIERKIDIGAKAANEQYNKNNSNGLSWNKLGTFTQASNRAVIRDIYNKKVLFELCKGSTDESLDFLSQYEHSRWNAFYYAHGWRVMPVSDLTEDEKATYKTKHADEKRHICLVSWNELDALPQEKPGLLKYYDYENVKEALREELKTDR